MRRCLLLLTPLLLIALAACSQPEIKPQGPSLAITPETVEAQVGGAAVPFTATLEGVSGEVAWALVPGEGGALSTATGFETSYTPPASPVTPITVVLTASAGDLTAFARITLTSQIVRLTR